MINVMFQIKYDFINGIVHQWKKFLLIAVVYAVLITDFLVRCKTKHFMGQYTSSDIILYIFRGMRWIVDVQTDINIPTAYILPNILIGFASFLRVNRSIKFISFDDGEHAGHDFST